MFQNNGGHVIQTSLVKMSILLLNSMYQYICRRLNKSLLKIVKLKTNIVILNMKPMKPMNHQRMTAWQF